MISFTCVPADSGPCGVARPPGGSKHVVFVCFWKTWYFSWWWMVVKLGSCLGVCFFFEFQPCTENSDSFFSSGNRRMVMDLWFVKNWLPTVGGNNMWASENEKVHFFQIWFLANVKDWREGFNMFQPNQHGPVPNQSASQFLPSICRVRAISLNVADAVSIQAGMQVTQVWNHHQSDVLQYSHCLDSHVPWSESGWEECRPQDTNWKYFWHLLTLYMVQINKCFQPIPDASIWIHSWSLQWLISWTATEVPGQFQGTVHVEAADLTPLVHLAEDGNAIAWQRWSKE